MADETPLKLVHAYVRGVLGIYNHEIPFDPDSDYVIIYGPNGVGKTKTLEVIHAISQLDGKRLCSLPFDFGEVDLMVVVRLYVLVEGPMISCIGK